MRRRADKVAKAKTLPLTIKEGAEYRMKVRFRVQHEIVTGLKYLQVVKRAGIQVDKADEMIGSYAPQAEPYVKACAMEQAPSGMMMRGHYTAKSRFVDDDKNVYLEWEWAFDIKKVRAQAHGGRRRRRGRSELTRRPPGP